MATRDEDQSDHASKALTSREVECLRWLGEGKSLADTAVILDLSPRTIKFHQNNGRRTLGCLTNTHAVAAAIRRGLI